MDRRFLTVLGVSLLFALVISSVFYQMTARAGGSKKVEQTDLKDIVIAARPLSVGVTVKPADIKLGKIAAVGVSQGRIYQSRGSDRPSGDQQHPHG